jgi:hypothetical protein
MHIPPDNQSGFGLLPVLSACRNKTPSGDAWTPEMELLVTKRCRIPRRLELKQYTFFENRYKPRKTAGSAA